MNLNESTRIPSGKDIPRKWFVLDASGQTLGAVAEAAGLSVKILAEQESVSTWIRATPALLCKTWPGVTFNIQIPECLPHSDTPIFAGNIAKLLAGIVGRTDPVPSQIYN